MSLLDAMARQDSIVETAEREAERERDIERDRERERQRERGSQTDEGDTAKE